MPRPTTRTMRSAAGLFVLALATAFVSVQTLAAPPVPAAKAASAAPAKAEASTLPASTDTAIAASVPTSALLASLAPTVLACAPPAPSAALKLADCCQKGANTYVGKYDFCYCAPMKMATVCRLGPGASQNPQLKEAARCQTLSTHPYWPAQSISCTN